MFRILWYPDARSEYYFILHAHQFTQLVDILEALRFSHDRMVEVKLLSCSYLYEVQAFNVTRGEWGKWKDHNTGIDDPIEFLEYEKEVLG